MYIDIDGVLLTAKQPRPADNAIDFINFITVNFECYWLSTHCKGNIDSAISYLAKYFDANTIERLKLINPTNWDTLKTEAIDFSSEFYWLDDCPFQSEIDILNQHLKQKSLIVVNLDNMNELNRIKALLETV